MMSDNEVNLDETLELDTSFEDGESDDEVASNSSFAVFSLNLKDSGGEEKKIPLVPGLNRVGRDHNRCRIVLRSPSVSKLHAVIEVKSNRAFIWDVGSRNRTHRNSTQLSWGGRFQLGAGDRLRFGDVDAVIESRTVETEDDVLVPDSQPQEDGRKSSTKIAADFSLLSEDGCLDYSAIDSSYSRLRTTICDIVQDSILESTVADDADPADSTESTDATLEDGGDDDDDDERTGGLFTQTYSPDAIRSQGQSPIDVDDDDDDDASLLSSQNTVKNQAANSRFVGPTQRFVSADAEKSSVGPKPNDEEEESAETQCLVAGKSDGVAAEDAETQAAFSGVDSDGGVGDEPKLNLQTQVFVSSADKDRSSSPPEVDADEDVGEEIADATQIFDDLRNASADAAFAEASARLAVGKRVQFVSPDENSKAAVDSPCFRRRSGLPRMPQGLDESSDEDAAPTQQLVFKAPPTMAVKASTRRSSILKTRPANVERTKVQEEPETQTLNEAEVATKEGLNSDAAVQKETQVFIAARESLPSAHPATMEEDAETKRLFPSVIPASSSPREISDDAETQKIGSEMEERVKVDAGGDEAETQMIETAASMGGIEGGEGPVTRPLEDGAETQMIEASTSEKLLGDDANHSEETQVLPRGGLSTEETRSSSEEVAGEAETQMLTPSNAQNVGNVVEENAGKERETRVLDSTADKEREIETQVMSEAHSLKETNDNNPLAPNDNNPLAPNVRNVEKNAEKEMETRVLDSTADKEREMETQVLSEAHSLKETNNDNNPLAPNVANVVQENAGKEMETRVLDSTADKEREMETQVLSEVHSLKETNNDNNPSAPNDSNPPALNDSNPPAPNDNNPPAPPLKRVSSKTLLKSLVAPGLDKLETQDFDDALGRYYDEDKENLVKKMNLSLMDGSKSTNLVSAAALLRPVGATIIQSPTRSSSSKESQHDEFYDSFESLTPQKPRKKKGADGDDPESQYFDADPATPVKRIKTTPTHSPTTAGAKKSRKVFAARMEAKTNAATEDGMAPAGKAPANKPDAALEVQNVGPSNVVPSSSTAADDGAASNVVGTGETATIMKNAPSRRSKGGENLTETGSVVDVFDFGGILSDSPNSSFSQTSASSSSQASLNAAGGTAADVVDKASKENEEKKLEGEGNDEVEESRTKSKTTRKKKVASKDDDEKKEEEDAKGEDEGKRVEEDGGGGASKKEPKPKTTSRRKKVVVAENCDNGGEKSDRREVGDRGQAVEDEGGVDVVKNTKEGKGKSSRTKKATTMKEAAGDIDEDEGERKDEKGTSDDGPSSKEGKENDDEKKDGKRSRKSLMPSSSATKDGDEEAEKSRAAKSRRSVKPSAKSVDEKEEEEEEEEKPQGKKNRKSANATSAAGKKRASAVKDSEPVENIREDDGETQAYAVENGGVSAASAVVGKAVKAKETKKPVGGKATGKGSKMSSKKDSTEGETDAAFVSEQTEASDKGEAPAKTRSVKDETSSSDAASSSSSSAPSSSSSSAATDASPSSSSSILYVPPAHHPKPPEEITPPRPTGDSQSTEPPPATDNDDGVPAAAQWSCPLCTFLNHGDIQECEMCLSPRVFKKTRKSEILPSSPLRIDRLSSPKSKRTAKSKAATVSTASTSSVDRSSEGGEMVEEQIEEAEEKKGRGKISTKRRAPELTLTDDVAEKKTVRGGKPRKIVSAASASSSITTASGDTDSASKVEKDDEGATGRVTGKGRGKGKKIEEERGEEEDDGKENADNNPEEESKLRSAPKAKPAPSRSAAASGRGKRTKKSSEGESTAASSIAAGEDPDVDDVETSSTVSAASSGTSSSTIHSSDGNGRRSSRRKTVVLGDDAASLVVDGTLETGVESEKNAVAKEVKSRKPRSRKTPTTNEALADVEEEEEVEEIPAKRKRGAAAKKK